MRVLGRAGGKIEPGLSSFANSPEAAATYILPLLVNASKLVPSEKHASTKVRLCVERCYDLFAIFEPERLSR